MTGQIRRISGNHRTKLGPVIRWVKIHRRQRARTRSRFLVLSVLSSCTHRYPHHRAAGKSGNWNNFLSRLRVGMLPFWHLLKGHSGSCPVLRSVSSRRTIPRCRPLPLETGHRILARERFFRPSLAEHIDGTTPRGCPWDLRSENSHSTNIVSVVLSWRRLRIYKGRWVRN